MSPSTGKPVERWLLPDGVEEMLPAAALRLENERRRLLDLYACWGYELVITPLIEYLESLLVTGSRDLDLQTFKVTDQLSGRMMGVRADITPQAARIDAHSLRREEPVRLCYAGSVLHTRPETLGASRSPIQVGAELYGHAGAESDIEVMHLMVETLRLAGVSGFQLDLGHVGVFRELAHAAGLDGDRERALFSLLQRKALPEIDALVGQSVDDPALAAMLRELPRLNGGDEILDEAERLLSGAPAAATEALGNIREIAEGLRARVPDLEFYFDLSELRGYHYHTGVVFSAYLPEHGQAVAHGGRYDDIGRLFGRARPATGFSADLKLLAAEGEAANPREAEVILAPAGNDAGLLALVGQLRQAGERVIQFLPGQAGERAGMGADREIVRQGDEWAVVPVTEAGS